MHHTNQLKWRRRSCFKPSWWPPAWWVANSASRTQSPVYIQHVQYDHWVLKTTFQKGKALQTPPLLALRWCQLFWVWFEWWLSHRYFMQQWVTWRNPIAIPLGKTHKQNFCIYPCSLNTSPWLNISLPQGKFRWDFISLLLSVGKIPWICMAKALCRPEVWQGEIWE